MASLSKKPLSFSKGEVVEGTVSSKSDREIILDLGTKSEGVLQLHNISENDKDNIKVGDKISCIVDEPENESGQVLLSFPSPQSGTQGKPTKDWSKFISKYQKGEVYKGKVTKLTSVGVFVELEPGFEGLIRGSNATGNLETGQEISVNLDELDLEKQRMSLSPVLTSTKGLIYK